MSTISTASQLTQLELAKRTHNGDVIAIAELLKKKNAILDDAVWQEANDFWSHKFTTRQSEPAGTFHGLNEGVDAESSTTNEVTELIAMVSSYSKPDKALIDNSPNAAKTRMQEASAFIAGMGKTLASKIFYGNPATAPKEFKGLATRMGTLNSTTIIGQSGTGSDVTSIYVVGWGEDENFLIYPRAHKTAGIEREDMGVQLVQDASSKTYRAYVDWFKCYAGMVCKNPRSIGRLANIETSGSSNIFDEDNLIRVINNMDLEGLRPVIYCNRTIMTQMQILLKDKTNVNFEAAKGEGLAGVPVLTFMGIPVKRCDAILNTESAIS